MKPSNACASVANVALTDAVRNPNREKYLSLYLELINQKYSAYGTTTP
jgi:hypothetical protein